MSKTARTQFRLFGQVLLLILLVRGYRLLLKPWLGNACRFEPTCSAYALQALQQHGAVAGSALAAGRLLRCHPWCPGGCDPVPQRLPGLFGQESHMCHVEEGGGVAVLGEAALPEMRQRLRVRQRLAVLHLAPMHDVPHRQFGDLARLGARNVGHGHDAGGNVPWAGAGADARPDGLFQRIIENDAIFRPYVVHYTNAATIVGEEFVDTVAELNARVSSDNERPADVAQDWLSENGFIGG